MTVPFPQGKGSFATNQEVITLSLGSCGVRKPVETSKVEGAEGLVF